jgi:hypothetical protein
MSTGSARLLVTIEVDGFRVGRPLLMKKTFLRICPRGLQFVKTTYAAFTLPRPLVEPELLL